MKKKNVLALLNDARFYHINWLSHVEGLIKGYKLDADKTPVIKTDCKFGKWLYNEAQEIRDFNEFKEVEFYHDKVHKNLLNLMVYLDKKVDKNFFNRAKVKRQETRINIYFEQVKNASYDLLKALNKFEAELKEKLVDTGESDLLQDNLPVTPIATSDDVIAKAFEQVSKSVIKKGKKKMTKGEKAIIDQEIKRILGGE